MEELEKRKMSKKGKMMLAFSSPNIRTLVNKANELNIPREDVVTIVDRREELVLIYYK